MSRKNRCLQLRGKSVWPCCTDRVCVVVHPADISNAGACALATGILANSTIQDLDLSWNGVTEVGGLRFGEVLGVNRSLTRLSLASNRITAPAAAVIADALRYNTVIETMDLCNNPLGTRGPRRNARDTGTLPYRGDSLHRAGLHSPLGHALPLPPPLPISLTVPVLLCILSCVFVCFFP